MNDTQINSTLPEIQENQLSSHPIQSQHYQQITQSQLPNENLLNQKKKEKGKICRFWNIALLFGIIFIGMCGFVIYKGIYLQEELFSSNPNSQVYDLIKLNSTAALCLDGSAGSYYLSKKGDPSKILIFFCGGAWCGQDDDQKTLESCYQRSKTWLGSSNYFSPHTTYSEGILSKDARSHFRDWKKVFFNYCDGSGHQGTKKQPVQYKDKSLYFRGHNITTQKFQDLEKKIGLFSKASQFVLTGQSAGGLATFTWANYLGQKVKNGKVFAIPDAGIFYDSQNKNTNTHSYKNKFVNIMKLSNAQIDPPVPECIQDFPNEKQNCMFAQNMYKHIKVPLFPVQSVYDSWSIPNILGIGCIQNGISTCSQQDRKIIEDHRNNVTQLLEQINKVPKNGAWGVSCVRHGTLGYPQYIDPSLTVPQLSQFTPAKSLANWFDSPDSSNFHVDLQPWPVNKPCS